MSMEKPNSFGVMLNGKKTNLTEKLKMKKIKGFKTWAASYRFKKPGDYIFYVAPKPFGSLLKTNLSFTIQKL